MYCQSCGKEYTGNAKYCQSCGMLLMNKPVYSSSPQVTQMNTPKTTPQRELIVALILSIFFGNFGVDRFYLGYVGLGLLKMLTFGGCGIWWLIDIILIATRKVTDSSGMPLI